MCVCEERARKDALISDSAELCVTTEELSWVVLNNNPFYWRSFFGGVRLVCSTLIDTIKSRIMVIDKAGDSTRAQHDARTQKSFIALFYYSLLF